MVGRRRHHLDRHPYDVGWGGWSTAAAGLRDTPWQLPPASVPGLDAYGLNVLCRGCRHNRGRHLMALGPAENLMPPTHELPISDQGDHSHAWTRYNQDVADRLNGVHRGVVDGSNAKAGDVGEYLS